MVVLYRLFTLSLYFCDYVLIHTSCTVKEACDQLHRSQMGGPNGKNCFFGHVDS